LVPTLLIIAAAVQKYNLQGDKEIWVTGHSLGGALASLLTAMLIADGFGVAALYTYGAPRVGDNRFEEIFNEKFSTAYRVVNQDDVVPHLPPEFFGFSHSGHRILFDREGSRQEDKSTWIEFQEKMGAWLSHIPQAGIQIKGPHLLNSPEGYLTKLKHDVMNWFR
jgi:triacylglycerol lipase